MAKNRVWESMTVLRTSGSKVRIWREHSEFKRGPDEDLMDFWNKEGMRILRTYGAQQFMTQLEHDFPTITAIEVLDRDGDGALLYPDWS